MLGRVQTHWPTSRSERILPGVFAVFALAAAFGAGCGRPATRADCEIVVDKNVDLKLEKEGVTDPAVVAKRREEIRAALREDIDRCVGKRVTDAMMSCVKSARSIEAFDKCLR